jgi:predicted RNA binding protein YcfA (HicA-like mRNA interferase family)
MSPLVPGFKQVRVRKFRTLLQRELGYVVVRSSGSHKTLHAPGRPPLTLAFKDGDSIGAHMVRDILVKQVGLTLDEAREVVSRV